MAPILTFGEMQTKVMSWLDEVGDTDTTLNLTKLALQEAHVHRLTQERWPFMLYEPQLLNIVVGQECYTLHPEYLRPLYFWNRTALDYMTQYASATLLAARTDPNNDGADQNLKYVLFGRAEVAAQPPVPGTLTLVSDNAGDNAVQSVTVRGDTAYGMRSEAIACNSPGMVAFTKILKVTKSDGWLGTLTLRTTVGALPLLTLFPEELGRSFQQIKLLQIPTSAQVAEYQFYRLPSPLVNDNDRSDIPPPFEDVLVYDALLSFAAYNSYSAATVQLWMAKRTELVLAMQQAYSDAEALLAATNYTLYVPR